MFGDIDPRALEIYGKAVQAAKGLHRLAYRAEVGPYPERKAGGDARVRYFRVQLDFDGALRGSPARLRAEHHDGKELDAKVVESLVIGERDAVRITPATTSVVRTKTWHTVGGFAFGALPEWIFTVRVHADPLATEWGGATRIVGARFFGTERFDGVACDVIGIERENDIGSRLDLHGGTRIPKQIGRVRELLAIAQGDRLPRSVSLVDLGAVGAEPPADLRDADVLRLTEVKAEGAFEADTFSTATPSGFRCNEAGAEQSAEKPKP